MIELRRGGDNFHQWHQTYTGDEQVEGNWRGKSDNEEYIPSMEGDEDEATMIRLAALESGGYIIVNMPVNRYGDDNLSEDNAVVLGVDDESGFVITAKKGENGWTERTDRLGGDDYTDALLRRLSSVEFRVDEIERNLSQ